MCARCRSPCAPRRWWPAGWRCPAGRGVAHPAGRRTDYQQEATWQNRFAEAYADDPEVTVPRVLEATSRVMISQWLGGTDFARLALTGEKSERDLAGQLYQRFFLVSPGRRAAAHRPAPGQLPARRRPARRAGFRIRPADPGGLPQTFGRLIAGMLAGDDRAVARRLRDDGFIRPGRRLEVDKLADTCRRSLSRRDTRRSPTPGMAALGVRPDQRSA